MKIVFTKKESRANILIVNVDEEPWREIHTTIFSRYPSFPSNFTTIPELDTWFATAEQKAAFHYALRRLAMKSHATTELKKKLEERLVSEKSIEKVIADCKRLGYLNDEAWFESFVRQQMAKNLGPHAILMKLRMKGIESEKAQSLLSSMDNSTHQRLRIKHLLNTKYRNKDLSEYKERNKVISSLMRKGFPLDQIHNVIRNSIDFEDYD